MKTYQNFELAVSPIRSHQPLSWTPRRERGIALLLCLFALLLMTSIALGLMYMSDTETRVNDNFRSSVQAYSAARGGLEEARDRMRPTNPSPLTLPGSLPPAAGGVLYLLNPAGNNDSVAPWDSANAYFDDEICQENFAGLGVSNPGSGIRCGSAPSGRSWYQTANSTAPFTNTAAAISYKWVRVTLKGNNSEAPYSVDGSNTNASQVCWTGVTEAPLPAGFANCAAWNPDYVPVYLTTSLAVTPTGARRMMQSELVQLKLPPMPSSFTFDGSSPSWGTTTSNQYYISGVDQHSCGSQQPAVPAVGAIDTTSVNTLAAAIPSNRQNHYTGTAGHSIPDVENVSSTMDAAWKTPAQLDAIVAMVTQAASQVITGPASDINLGSASNPMVTVVNGNLTMNGASNGAGILVVTGNLTFNGTPTFNGVILVIGQGVLTVSGGGGGQFNGAVLVAKTRDSSGNLLPANGSPSVDWSGGGGNGIYYDSCWINGRQNNYFYKLAQRELPY